MPTLRLAVIASGDPDDPATYSGVPYFALSALRRRKDIVPIPLVPGSLSHSKGALRKNRWSRRLFGKTVQVFQPMRTLRKFAACADRLIKEAHCDVVLCINVDPIIGLLRCDQPIVHSSDTTLAAIADYYPAYENIWGPVRARADALTLRSLQSAAFLTYPSHWAARSAQERYDVAAERVHVIPYGANLDPVPGGESVTASIASRIGETCKLLFIGRDWTRKGGPLLLETLNSLRAEGVQAEATLVGCDPGVSHPHVTVYPFLDKRVAKQRELYARLWEEASFLVMPSHQETFGAIYAEAAANGVPSIALDTGGVADAIDNGVSGFVLHPSSASDEIAKVIRDAWPNTPRYKGLSLGARHRFETVLNWNAWAERIAQLAYAAKQELV